MDLIILPDSSSSSNFSQLLAGPNSTDSGYLEYLKNHNRQAFFLIGMSFLGGLISGIILNCLYTLLINHIVKQLDWEDSFPEGHVNLSFIGEDCSRPFDDPPPQYSAVVEGSDEGRRRGPFFGFFDRFSMRRSVSEEHDETPPPSYSSCLVSLESDLNSR